MAHEAVDGEVYPRPSLAPSQERLMRARRTLRTLLEEVGDSSNTRYGVLDVVEMDALEALLCDWT